MNQRKPRLTGLSILALATIFTGTIVLAQVEPMSFPDLGSMVHYATVERGSTLERALTTREAVDAVKAGQPIPPGTQVVLEIYQSGDLEKTFVMQKEEGLAENGGWQFVSFAPDQSIDPGEAPARCASCHRSREDSDYMFLRDRIVNFE